MTSASLPSDPIAELWQTARAWCARALAELGDPAAIAAAVAREAYAACRRRLALLEQFVLKLLLIEASRLPVTPANAPPASSRQDQLHILQASDTRPESAGWKPAVRCEDPARPETWRVRFQARFAPIKRALATQRRAVVMPRFRANSNGVDRAQARARTLARRFEALRRILADPRRAAIALARKLAALGARAYAVARRIALAAPRQGGGMTFAGAIILALDASASWSDTS